MWCGPDERHDDLPRSSESSTQLTFYLLWNPSKDHTDYSEKKIKLVLLPDYDVGDF